MLQKCSTCLEMHTLSNLSYASILQKCSVVKSIILPLAKQNVNKYGLDEIIILNS